MAWHKAFGEQCVARKVVALNLKVFRGWVDNAALAYLFVLWGVYTKCTETRAAAKDRTRVTRRQGSAGAGGGGSTGRGRGTAAAGAASGVGVSGAGDGISVAVKGRAIRFVWVQGLPQGRVTSPILFEAFTNDLLVMAQMCGVGIAVGMESGSREKVWVGVLAFVDDVAGVFGGHDQMLSGARLLFPHIEANDGQLSMDKTEFVVYSPRGLPKAVACEATPDSFTVGSCVVRRVLDYRYLGMLLDEGLTMAGHVAAVAAATWCKYRKICALDCDRPGMLGLSERRTLFRTVLVPTFAYGLGLVLALCGADQRTALRGLYTGMLRGIMRLRPGASEVALCWELGLLPWGYFADKCVIQLYFHLAVGVAPYSPMRTLVRGITEVALRGDVAEVAERLQVWRDSRYAPTLVHYALAVTSGYYTRDEINEVFGKAMTGEWRGGLRDKVRVRFHTDTVAAAATDPVGTGPVVVHYLARYARGKEKLTAVHCTDGTRVYLRGPCFFVSLVRLRLRICALYVAGTRCGLCGKPFDVAHLLEGCQGLGAARDRAQAAMRHCLQIGATRLHIEVQHVQAATGTFVQLAGEDLRLVLAGELMAWHKAFGEQCVARKVVALNLKVFRGWVDNAALAYLFVLWGVYTKCTETRAAAKDRTRVTRRQGSAGAGGGGSTGRGRGTAAAGAASGVGVSGAGDGISVAAEAGEDGYELGDMEDVFGEAVPEDVLAVAFELDDLLLPEENREAMRDVRPEAD
jgi:hypothetical protein